VRQRDTCLAPRPLVQHYQAGTFEPKERAIIRVPAYPELRERRARHDQVGSTAVDASLPSEQNRNGQGSAT
jgi:hypothetical protein